MDWCYHESCHHSTRWLGIHYGHNRKPHHWAQCSRSVLSAGRSYNLLGFQDDDDDDGHQDSPAMPLRQPSAVVDAPRPCAPIEPVIGLVGAVMFAKSGSSTPEAARTQLGR